MGPFKAVGKVLPKAGSFVPKSKVSHFRNG